jgi:hypothetical protein
MGLSYSAKVGKENLACKERMLAYLLASLAKCMAITLLGREDAAH